MVEPPTHPGRAGTRPTPSATTVVVTALGTSAAFPGPNDACSGWLLQSEAANILVDCGTGVVANLQRFIDPAQLSAVIITHMHADHFFDLVPLRYGFRYSLARHGRTTRLLLPPGGADTVRRVVRPLSGDSSGDFFGEDFAVAEFDPALPLTIGDVEVRFTATNHYIPCWAAAFVAPGARVTYTADTAPSRAVAALARGSDLLIAEATYLTLAEESPVRRGHLTAEEAGELAAEVGAGSALLTHMWPHRDRELVLALARRRYSGALGLAKTARIYEVASGGVLNRR